MTKRHDIAIQHSSKRSDWRTPPELFSALRREFIFDLDVASDADHVGIAKAWGSIPSGGANEYYLGPGSALAEDALSVDWHALELPTAAHGDPICFMNPPYSRGDSKADPPIPPEPIAPWIAKAWTESQQGATVVGVLPFSPQTIWYRNYVYGLTERGEWMGHAAMEVRQLPYRVTFIDPDTTEPAANAPGNTCVVVWRENPGYVGPWQPTVRYWSYK